MVHEAVSPDPYIVSLRSDWDVSVARMAARDLARRIGFSATDQARIATTASQLARQVVAGNADGRAVMRGVQRGTMQGIELRFEHTDPHDLTADETLAHGYNDQLTGSYPPASSLMMDEVEVEPPNGQAAALTCRKWVR